MSTEYQLRIDGKAVMYATDMSRDIMDRWIEECAKDPEATRQVEIVRVKEDAIYNQYVFHKIRQQHERHRAELAALDKRQPPCKHGTILYGRKCINCEREQVELDQKVMDATGPLDGVLHDGYPAVNP